MLVKAFLKLLDKSKKLKKFKDIRLIMQKDPNDAGTLNGNFIAFYDYDNIKIALDPTKADSKDKYFMGQELLYCTTEKVNMSFMSSKKELVLDLYVINFTGPSNI